MSEEFPARLQKMEGFLQNCLKELPFFILWFVRQRDFGKVPEYVVEFDSALMEFIQFHEAVADENLVKIYLIGISIEFRDTSRYSLRDN